MDPLSKALAKARASRAALSQADQGEGVVDRGLEQPERLPVERTRPTQRNHLEAHRILTNSGNAVALAAFKQLRTQVVQRMRTNGWRTLVVTSPREGNGKTVTAINLAVNLARQTHSHVLLADLDLRQPSVQHYLSAETAPGISDYILSDTPMDEILFNPAGIEGLTVLPGREAFSHSSEALLLRKTVDLITALQSQYADGFLILDMPPVLATDDVLAFSNHWDAALLVVEEGSTTEPDLRRALDMLSVKPLLGTVMTKSQSALPSDAY
ncbi:CpsD/CapB family tyrosine-protein kinase [Thiocapsa marina]|uniref:Uncharacterized protein n=1 Tax=Thiocapsa marina 5811 TaxID=768671 RepID=F9UAQ6_9GAMM|nr:CpsD/CapB family tyrosine-protein kinase [Thiocapsa marina]EGV18524.1 hypothetical protein ThimaDRAFT_1942 [Thiocapsa marina 5811]